MKPRADRHRGEGLVFLLSMPRSGSTVFSMMLGTHSTILSPPEPWLLLSLADFLGIGDLGRIPYGEDSALLATAKFLNQFPAAGEGPWLGSTIGKAAEARSVGVAPETVLRDLSEAIYAKSLRLANKGLFLDKTPRYYRILPLVDRIFPLAKKIFLARNPLDVAVSYMSTWGVPIDAICGISASANSHDFCHGLFQFQKYFARRSPTKLVVRYEALVQNPAVVLAQTCKFLGIEFEPGMLYFYENGDLMRAHGEAAVGDPRATKKPAPLDAASVDRWRTQLSAEDKSKLAATLGAEIFVRLGYAKVPAQLRAEGVTIPPAKTAESHRKAVLLRQAADGKKTGRGELGTLERMANCVLIERSSQAWLINKLETDLSAVAADREQLRTAGERASATTAALEQDRNAKAEAAARLTAELAAADADRAQQLRAKEALAAENAMLEQDRNAKGEAAARLTAELAAADADRRQQLRAKEALAAENATLEQDRNAKGEAAARLTAELAAADADRRQQRQARETLAAEKTALEQDRIAKAEALGRLTAELATAKADRQQLLRQSEQLAAEKAALEASRKALLGDTETLKEKMRTSVTEAQALRVEGSHLEQKSVTAHKLAAEARAESSAVREALIWQTKSHAEQIARLTTEARTEARSHAERAEKVTAEAHAETNALRAAMVGQAKSHAARFATITQLLEDASRREHDLRVRSASLNDQLQSAIEQIAALTAWVHEARAEAQQLRTAYDGTLSGRVARIAQRLRRPRPRAPGKPAT